MWKFGRGVQALGIARAKALGQDRASCEEWACGPVWLEPGEPCGKREEGRVTGGERGNWRGICISLNVIENAGRRWAKERRDMA